MQKKPVRIEKLTMLLIEKCEFEKCIKAKKELLNFEQI